MWTDNELSARIDQTVEWLQKKLPKPTLRV